MHWCVNKKNKNGENFMKKATLILVVLLLVPPLYSVTPKTLTSKETANRASSGQTPTAGSTSTIFTENFEGAFPYSWSVLDHSDTEGYDYWDKTSYRSYSGTQSGWCAQIGTQTLTVTIFEEEFWEGFPGAYWNVGDWHPTNGYDYWGYTNYRRISGNWAGWCAQIGAQHDTGDPNSVVHEYDNYMDAYMYRAVTLSGYTSVRLFYRYWIKSESYYDYLAVMYYSEGSWYYIDHHDGNSGGWQYSWVLSIPTSATYVGFFFHSDGSFHDEGAYIDQVILEGFLEIPNSSVHTYDQGMWAYMYRAVTLSCYTSVSLSYRYWLNCSLVYDYDRLEVIYYSYAGGWNYIDTHTGDSGGWQYSTVTIPTDAFRVGFYFQGHYGGGEYEGAYIDDVTLTGIALNRTYLIVRGMNDGIYYRSRTGGVWGDWTMLPGATTDSPAAAVLGNNLHIAVKGLDGNIWHGYVNLSTSTWSGWAMVPGATPSPPTLTASAACFAMVVRGLDNRIYYNFLSWRGWVGWTALPGATTDRCAAAVSGDCLHIVVKGLTGEIWHSYVYLLTGEWSGWSMLSGATPSTPELTASATKLYLVVRGMNDGIFYRSWDGAFWSGWTELPGATINSPAAAVPGNNLHIVVKGLTGEIWHGYVDLTTSVWSGWSLLSGATPSTPDLTA